MKNGMRLRIRDRNASLDREAFTANTASDHARNTSLMVTKANNLMLPGGSAPHTAALIRQNATHGPISHT